MTREMRIKEITEAALSGDDAKLDQALAQPSYDFVHPRDSATQDLAALKEHDAVSRLLAKGACKGHAVLGYSKVGDIENIVKLLDQGAPINLKDGWNETPIIQAARNNFYDLVTLLLDRGADIAGHVICYSDPSSGGSPIPRQDTFLKWAIRKDRMDIFLKYLEKGVDLNTITDSGSAVMLAAYLNRNEYLNILIDRGAKINLKFGETALMRAAQGGSVDTFKTLLVRGAKIDDKDSEGRSVLSYIRNWGHHDMYERSENDNDVGFNIFLEFVMTPHQNSRSLDLLKLINDGMGRKTPQSLKDSLELYKLIKAERFVLAKKWLETHDKLPLHFVMETHGSLYHLVIKHYQTQRQLMSDILTLLTEKHHADPYIPDINGKLAIELLQEQSIVIPKSLFACESHMHLYYLLGRKEMTLLEEVLSFRNVLPSKAGVGKLGQTSEQQVESLRSEINTLRSNLKKSAIPTPKPILDKLNHLLENVPVKMSNTRMNLIPMKFSHTEHENFQSILINLQKINGLVLSEINDIPQVSANPSSLFGAKAVSPPIQPPTLKM